MKNIFFILLIFASGLALAQSPQMFNYQSVIRDSSGKLIQQENIGIKVSIIQGDENGETIYSEMHEVETNQFGQIFLKIGMGIPLNEGFSAIDWGSDNYFIKTEFDIENDGSFELASTSSFASVPYALFAENSGDQKWKKSSNEDIYYKEGNVGIGKTNPEAKIHIATNTSNENQPFILLEDTSAMGSYIKLGDGSTLEGHFNPVIEGNSVGVGSPDRTGLWLWGRLSEDQTDDRGMGFRVYDNSGGKILNAPLFTWFNQNDEVMRVSPEGRLGIGKENPIAKLNIADNVSIDTQALIQLEDSSATGSYLRFKDGTSLPGHFNPVIEGNSVGVGSPDRTGLWLWGRLSEDNDDDRGMGFRVYDNSGGKILNAPLFTWFNQNDEIMRISPEGNLGIGTSTPNSKIQVSDGDIYIEDATKGVIMTSPNGTCWRMTVDDTGNPNFTAIACP